MARPKGSHDVAPMIRGAFMRAVRMIEEGKSKKSLSEIIMEQLTEHPLETLRTMASFTPKEVDVTTRQGITDVSQLNDEELEQLASLAASIISEYGEGETGESEKVTH